MFSAFATGLVDVMSLPPGTRLLDLGCGRGAVTRAALARRWDVVAVDAAPTMVTELRRDQPSVDARVMDAHALDLPTDAFDAVAASFVIHLVDDPSQVLAEARRVVRRGGLVAMTVPGPLSDQSRWDRYFGLLRDFKPDPETAPVTRPTDVAALFAVAGLEDYRQERLEIDLPVASPELAWRHEMSHASPATCGRCARTTSGSSSDWPWASCSGCTTREGSGSSAAPSRTSGESARRALSPADRRLGPSSIPRTAEIRTCVGTRNGAIEAVMHHWGTSLYEASTATLGLSTLRPTFELAPISPTWFERPASSSRESYAEDRPLA